MRTDHHLHLDKDELKAIVDNNPLTLTIKVQRKGGVVSDHDFTFFAESLDAIRDLGYEIVNGCNAIKLAPVDIDFGESLEANVPYVPFAINDAVEHDEAMASMPPGYDPEKGGCPMK